MTTLREQMLTGTVTVPVVLGSGKQAIIAMPADVTDNDIKFLLRAVLDIADKVQENQSILQETDPIEKAAESGLIVPGRN